MVSGKQERRRESQVAEPWVSWRGNADTGRGLEHCKSQESAEATGWGYWERRQTVGTLFSSRSVSHRIDVMPPRSSTQDHKSHSCQLGEKQWTRENIWKLSFYLNHEQRQSSEETFINKIMGMDWITRQEHVKEMKFSLQGVTRSHKIMKAYLLLSYKYICGLLWLLQTLISLCIFIKTAYPC